MRFSEREGFEKKTLQVDSVDRNLRIKLWNFFVKTIDDECVRLFKDETDRWMSVILIHPIFKVILQYELVETIDEYGSIPKDAYILMKNIKLFGERIEKMRNKIKDYLLSCEWYKVYDFFEFLINKSRYKMFMKKKFNQKINKILEEEKSAYRIVENTFARITDELEIKEIELVLKNPIGAVKEHIKQALVLYSDKHNPDYRNSIKESICAVESISRLISKNTNATLGDALKIIEKSDEVELHPALKDAFSKLYGWTSDKKSGIRHGLMEISNIQAEDAQFMLIACSAFINYLVEKANKASITLK